MGFTTTFANKNKEKFVNFYTKLRLDEKETIDNAIKCYVEERGTAEFILNPYLKREAQAVEIFTYLQFEGIMEIMVTSDFKEVLLFPFPFTYNEGKSNYWNNIKTQNSYING